MQRRERRDDRARSARSPSARTAPATGCRPSCRTIAPPRRRLRSGRRDSRRSSPAIASMIACERRGIAISEAPRLAPGRGCPGPPPYRSRPSTGCPQSRASVVSAGKRACDLRHGRDRSARAAQAPRCSAASAASTSGGDSRGPSPASNAQILAQRVGHDQDVGEQDRAVEAEAADRLERDLGRGLAVVDQLEEAALLGPQRAIFGQIAPRLAHQPDRELSGLPPLSDAEQGLVEQRASRHRTAPLSSI